MHYPPTDIHGDFENNRPLRYQLYKLPRKEIISTDDRRTDRQTDEQTSRTTTIGIFFRKKKATKN